jgi:hypothetical protein
MADTTPCTNMLPAGTHEFRQYLSLQHWRCSLWALVGNHAMLPWYSTDGSALLHVP